MVKKPTSEKASTTSNRGPIPERPDAQIGDDGKKKRLGRALAELAKPELGQAALRRTLVTSFGRVRRTGFGGQAARPVIAS